MEDSPKKLKETSIMWENVGGGSLKLKNGKTIKGGGRFSALESEISLGFRDVVKNLEPLPSEVGSPVSFTRFEVRESGDGYNIFNLISGKKLVSIDSTYEKAVEILKEIN